MRGKANHGEKLETFDGITPAYAGKRLESTYMLPDVGDHPRLCGEKTQQAQTGGDWVGSMSLT